jgi:3-oxoadipate enol-lactonase
MEMTLHTATGVKLALKRTGMSGGTPIIFIHSLGCQSQYWEPVMRLLPAESDLIAYDLRGHGTSDIPPEPYTISDHVRDLGNVMAFCEVDSAVLVGISLGGMIAMAYTAAFPASVKGLVLCDTSTTIGTTIGWNERIDSVRQFGLDALADTIMARWFAPSFKEQQSACYQSCKAMFIGSSATGYIANCAVVRDTNLADQAPHIAAKTLVMCGTEDVATPPHLCRKLAETIPGAAFEVIADAGHLPCIEQPAAVAALISSFLKGLEHG